MSCGCAGAGTCAECLANPRLFLPGQPGDTSGARPACAPSRSLAEQLGPTVDSLRQLYTDFGLRPYRVFSVVYEWSGGDVGRGTARVLSEAELLPTPSLKETSGVLSEERSAGLVERGSTRLEQVSPRYTEDEVKQLFHRLPLQPGQQGFVEVRVDARDGQTERRRFIVRGMPYRDAGAFQWKVSLMRQDEDRSRLGLPAPPSGR